MAIEARIRELGTRHQTLERAIQDELGRPAADGDRSALADREDRRAVPEAGWASFGGEHALEDLGSRLDLGFEHRQCNCARPLAERTKP